MDIQEILAAIPMDMTCMILGAGLCVSLVAHVIQLCTRARRHHARRSARVSAKHLEAHLVANTAIFAATMAKLDASLAQTKANLAQSTAILDAVIARPRRET